MRATAPFAFCASRLIPISTDLSLGYFLLVIILEKSLYPVFVFDALDGCQQTGFIFDLAFATPPRRGQGFQCLLSPV